MKITTDERVSIVPCSQLSFLVSELRKCGLCSPSYLGCLVSRCKKSSLKLRQSRKLARSALGH